MVMFFSNMFRNWMPLVGILFGVVNAFAANNLTFSEREISVGNIRMPFREAVNAGPNSRETALIIYLHGGTSKGNDNSAQMGEPGIDSFANYIEAAEMPATLLVPQCPADKSWGGPMLYVLKRMIESYTAKESVDENSVYIFGGSMGGTGVWSMLSEYPGLFAAAMPVAGNPSKSIAENVAQTPVYTVMGTADRIMSVTTASDFIDRLNALGDDTRMDVEDGWTHERTCIESYTTPRLNWVFGHRKTTAGLPPAAVSTEEIATIQYYTIEGRPLPSPPSSGLYISLARTTSGATIATKHIK